MRCFVSFSSSATNAGGRPPSDLDACRLFEGPSAPFEGNRRPFLVLTDEGIENVRRCSQRTGIGRFAGATELRLNNLDCSLARASPPTEAYRTGCQDIDDELEELLTVSEGAGPGIPSDCLLSLRSVSFFCSPSRPSA